MSRWFKVAAAAGALATAAIAAAGDAEARMCFRRTCAQNAPFVCKGPVGSCGFQQGACIRWRTERYWVNGWNCNPGYPGLH